MTASAHPFTSADRDSQLAIARRGTAYFAQRLADLSDEQLEEPSLLEGWSRKTLLAHVGYNAAALCRLMDWAGSGVRTPMYASPQARADEIAEGATLSGAALRNLFNHTVARLDEKWRRATEPVWTATVQTAQGRDVSASETVWMRSREVWIHAVDLNNGARFGDLPPEMLEGLLADVIGMWRNRGDGSDLEFQIDGRDSVRVDPEAHSSTVVAGDLAAVVRWITGRGALGLTTAPPDSPPRWL